MCSSEHEVQTKWSLSPGFSQLVVFDIVHVKHGLTGLLAEHHLLFRHVVKTNFFEPILIRSISFAIVPVTFSSSLTISPF